jgi:hypothetical protein
MGALPRNFPFGYPNTNQAAFLLKTSITEETHRRRRSLRELLQIEEEEKWYQTTFTALDGKQRHYSVGYFL